MRTSDKVLTKKLKLEALLLKLEGDFSLHPFLQGVLCGPDFAYWPVAHVNMLHRHLINADAACFCDVASVIGVVHGTCALPQKIIHYVSIVPMNNTVPCMHWAAVHTSTHSIAVC